MSAKTQLEPGDVVTVTQGGKLIYSGVELVSTPRATGDSWVFRNRHGHLYHVSEGITVIRYSDEAV